MELELSVTRPTAKRTTAGWKINVEFSDGTTDWLPLGDVKESNPIGLAEYAIASKIDHEPAFKWWVPLVLRKRHCMINKVKRNTGEQLTNMEFACLKQSKKP